MRRRIFLKMVALGAGAILSDRLRPFLRARADDQTFPVYLTFDDGPTTLPNLTGPTIRVLDTLKDEHVPATFFLHGRAIGDWTGPVIARMITDGHTVGNHLWRQGGNTVQDESPLALLAQQYIVTEKRIRRILEATNADVYARYLAQPKLFRRPGGNNGLTNFLDPKNFNVLRGAPYLQPYLGQLDWLKTVYDYSGWHVNGGDGITDLRIQPNTAAKIVTWILKGGYGYQGVDDYLCTGDPPRRSVEAGGGLIILLHDADKVTDDALPEIISQLRERGAEFHSLPRPQDKPNAKTVGIGYLPTPDPGGAPCEPKPGIIVRNPVVRSG
jgi:peptidoglycan/xylan/chitin deacetylase (PgdA/CDA1 family)